MITDTENETTKKTWQTPQIIDLDVADGTTGKNSSPVEASVNSGPGS